MGLEFISVEDVHWPLLFMDINTFEVINRSYETSDFVKLFATLHCPEIVSLSALIACNAMN